MIKIILLTEYNFHSANNKLPKGYYLDREFLFIGLNDGVRRYIFTLKSFKDKNVRIQPYRNMVFLFGKYIFQYKPIRFWV